MYLYLLEFTCAVEDHPAVKTWLSKANPDGILISTSQYGDELLSVLAHDQTLTETHKKLRQHPAISSCVEKQRVVYRITTITAPELVLSSFPLREGEEWYPGIGKMAYLCIQAHQLSGEQISWLTTNPRIVAWESFFDLIPMPEVR